MFKTKEDLKRAIAQKLYDIKKEAGIEEYSDSIRDWNTACGIIEFIDNLEEPYSWVERIKLEEYKSLGFIDMYNQLEVSAC